MCGGVTLCSMDQYHLVKHSVGNNHIIVFIASLFCFAVAGGTVALPELKRVIVAFRNRVVMEENLGKALNSILGVGISPKDLVASPLPQSLNVSNLGRLAWEHYNKAMAYSRQGKWAEYGREIEKLEKDLKLNTFYPIGYPYIKNFGYFVSAFPCPFPKNIALTSTTELNNTCKVSGLNANYHNVASLLLRYRYGNQEIRICRRFENGKISNL